LGRGSGALNLENGVGKRRNGYLPKKKGGKLEGAGISLWLPKSTGGRTCRTCWKPTPEIMGKGERDLGKKIVDGG